MMRFRELSFQKSKSDEFEMSRVIHIEEQEAPLDEEINRSSDAGESDASSGNLVLRSSVKSVEDFKCK
jgi:hypothetical protein